ncbi:PAS domain-containing protein [Marinobacterium rhizophilum]|uniref:PAS domain-containing protein n=1 Tax=Marinobacterium rhizophilum TaxID=420402 RepID=UPI00035F0465|nr:PAS domain-containing protein [Marinobacterium rhizophilum]
MSEHFGAFGCWPHVQEDIDPHRLLDSLDETVLVIDADERLLYANRSWNYLRADTPRGLGFLFSDCLHPADRPLWQRFFARLNTNEVSAPLSLRLLGSDAELYWCELQARPLAAGNPWPVSLTLRDISARVRQQQLRDASHRSLEQLLNGLPAMLYRARNNHDWSMEYVSAGCLELTGYCPEALINQTGPSFGALIHPEDAGTVWQQVQLALAERNNFELHYRLQHADGRIRRVSEKGRGLYAGTGAILGVEGIILALDGN